VRSFDESGLAEFNARLSREMAIETGVIERVYTLDRGTTELLSEKGIDAALIPREGPTRTPNWSPPSLETKRRRSRRCSTSCGLSREGGRPRERAHRRR
jgi:hypothetical protein